MSGFSRELKEARGQLGHKNARSFFQWLKAKGVSFNYSYYMRLEQGSLPSEKVTQELAAALKAPWADRLVLAHCRELFPRQEYLFTGRVETLAPAADSATLEPEREVAAGGQRELTPKQVAAIATSETSYHLFLLASLARNPVVSKDLERWFTAKAISIATKALSSAGVIRLLEGGFEAVAVETRFPDAYTQELKETYARFDKWDETFGQQFQLEYIFNKMLIRRVSGRYVQLIRRQLEGLFDLVRTSDELDSRYNENVLQLKVVLRQGKLPG